MTVKIKDRGWDRIKKELGSRRPKHVVIGILGSDASRAYPGEGATTVEVATWNHFGTSTIPARPFITSAVQENEEQISSVIRRLQKGVYELKVTYEDALALVGEKVRVAIIKRINEGMDPPNAPSTEDAKGSSKPLIDTGQLKGSITYEIRDDKGKSISSSVSAQTTKEARQAVKKAEREQKKEDRKRERERKKALKTARKSVRKFSRKTSKSVRKAFRSGRRSFKRLF